MRPHSFAVVVLSICHLTSFAYNWSTNPGDGSELNPYQISGPEQFVAIGADVYVFNSFFSALLNAVHFGQIPENTSVAGPVM